MFWTIPLTLCQNQQLIKGLVQGTTIEEALSLVADWLAIPDVQVKDIGEPYQSLPSNSILPPKPKNMFEVDDNIDIALPYDTTYGFQIPVKAAWIT
jgi:hypothetical protein